MSEVTPSSPTAPAPPVALDPSQFLGLVSCVVSPVLLAFAMWTHLFKSFSPGHEGSGMFPGFHFGVAWAVAYGVNSLTIRLLGLQAFAAGLKWWPPIALFFSSMAAVQFFEWYLGVKLH